MKKIIIGGFFIAVFVITGMTVGRSDVKACWFCSSDTPTETQAVQNNQKKLSVAVPLPVLENSLERVNISKRLSTFDDPAKISYIYLTSYGKVMAFYTVKGKVTSGGKRLTRQSVTVDGDGNVADVGNDVYDQTGAYAVEQPELDGTYGSSSPYIFFWTTEDAYVQWSGEYMLSDQPLKLTTTPELVRQIK